MRKKILLIAGCILCLTGCNIQRSSEKQDVTQTTTQEVTKAETAGDNDLVEDKSDMSTETAAYGQSSEFNWEGYKFIVTGDYKCTYAEDIGPIISSPDMFQMKIKAKESPYSELLQDKDSLLDVAREAGANDLSEVQETTINGNSYAYFKMELNGDKVLVVYSATPDGGKHFGAQIVIQSDSVSDEELLNMYASIVEKAVVTDEPDSSVEDFAGQDTFVTGEKKESSSLTWGETTVNFKVPSGYYSITQYDDELSATECFDAGNVSAMATLYKSFGNDAKYYAEGAADSGFSDEAQITNETVGDKTVYVVSSSYEHEGVKYSSMVGYCDIDEETYFEVIIDTRGENNLTFDMMRDFFQFQ